MNDEWNPDPENQLLRVTLDEIEGFEDKLSSACLVALLDEFEQGGSSITVMDSPWRPPPP
jgi:hypothetical protein